MLGLVDVGAAAAEAEGRAAHRLDRDVAGQDEQVRPGQLAAIFLLDRPEQAPRLVEIAIVRPAVERREALLARGRAAAPIAGAIGAGRMPGHADEERAVMPVIRRPPRLAVGHQRRQVALHRPIIKLLELVRIAEVVAIGIGRAVAAQQVEGQLLRPEVAAGLSSRRRMAAGCFLGSLIGLVEVMASIGVSPGAWNGCRPHGRRQQIGPMD
jgi:hypothetical protein